MIEVYAAIAIPTIAVTYKVVGGIVLTIRDARKKSRIANKISKNEEKLRIINDELGKKEMLLLLTEEDYDKNYKKFCKKGYSNLENFSNIKKKVALEDLKNNIRDFRGFLHNIDYYIREIINLLKRKQVIENNLENIRKELFEINDDLILKGVNNNINNDSNTLLTDDSNIKIKELDCSLDKIRIDFDNYPKGDFEDTKSRLSKMEKKLKKTRKKIEIMDSVYSKIDEALRINMYENVFTDKNTEIYELKEKYKYDDLLSDNKLNKNKNKNKKKTKKLSIKEN